MFSSLRSTSLMSSPMNQKNIAHVTASAYSLTDTCNRHDYGVQKNRKQASTGGGRAWSEDEEVYLLQTRLQKMPYKHIASHLKKTELACRLHYHQLSHGSNRRKRTDSITSSDTASTAQSPIMQHAMPSPIHENENTDPHSPQNYIYSHQSPAQIEFLSASNLLSRSTSNSPPRTLSHPVAILPKPAPRRALSDSATNPPLRLDCEVATTSIYCSNIDKERLRQIYEAHRASFWSVIAAEYGGSVSPLLLEEAWKRGVATNAPPTPCISPDTHTANGYQPFSAKPVQQQPITPVQENKTNATSISALLGIDASPRSPKERELIKRLEERREGSRDVVMLGVEMV